MSTVHKPNQTHSREHKAFSDHIGELRTRVMWVALMFIVTSAIAYNYRDILIDIVLAPLGHQKLVYLTPAGGFAFIFQVTMYAGVVVTAPLLIYQLYKFVRPALPLRAQKYSIKIVLFSVLLMIAGVCFGYFAAVPAALHFLTTFAGSYIEASLTADSYLNFIVAYVVGLGVLFQLPLLLIFWNWIQPLSGKKLLSSERFIILFAFIAAAIITPTPDPTNQTMVAVPIILIYQMGVVAVLLINKRQRKTSRRESAHDKKIVSQPSAAVSIMPPAPLIEQPASVIAAPPVPVAVQTPAIVPQTAKQHPAARKTVDGMITRRPARAQTTPVRRAEVRLLKPPRPVAQRPGRPGMNIDGVQRIVSA